MGLYPGVCNRGGLVTGRDYNRDFTVYQHRLAIILRKIVKTLSLQK